MILTEKKLELLRQHARAKLNLETARIAWLELQRFFAAGKVLVVSPALDLIDVGACMTIDDTEQVSAWLERGEIARVNDAQALEWTQANTAMWTVVVSPWILVQLEKPASTAARQPVQ
ncbi:MAG: DUF2288 domain-containing protein [Janthinobacterium lividum]